jgi:glycosyltransferase involved in cell wall biosynthesis
MSSPDPSADPTTPVWHSPGGWISTRHPLLVAGYFTAELGVGEAGRLLVGGLEAAGVPLVTQTLVDTGNRKTVPFADRPGEPDASRVVVVCDNADGVQRYAAACRPGFLAQRYVIGLWFWEVDRFPASMHGGFDVVDEVWAASDHVRRAVAAARRRPVRRIALPLANPAPAAALVRADHGLPEGFLFLVCFDHTSVVQRKNPAAAVAAFRRAFPGGDEPAGLVVKSINGDAYPEQRLELRAEAGGDPRIVFIDRYLSATDQRRLVATADAYVSLHRAEGLGLPMAEAMSLEKPVIATGYSGNLAFMDSENSLLVGYRLVPVPEGSGPYPPDARWAEPNLDEAAALMRRLIDHPEVASRIAGRARSSLLSAHSQAACVPVLLASLASAERRARLRRPARTLAARARAAAGRGRRALGRARRMIRRPPDPRGHAPRA